MVRKVALSDITHEMHPLNHSLILSLIEPYEDMATYKNHSFFSIERNFIVTAVFIIVYVSQDLYARHCETITAGVQSKKCSQRQ